MAKQTAMTAQAHPAPDRAHAGIVTRLAGVCAGPIVWSIHLVANYALASHSCFPGATPRAQAPAHAGRLWFALIAVDVIAMIVTLAAGLIAYRNWRSTRHETADHAPAGSNRARALFEIGEGRTRFLALWGVLTSAAFFLTVLFDLVGLFVLPLCR